MLVDRFLNCVVVFVCLTGVGLVGMVVHDVYGATPNKARATEAAWRERCIAKGGSLIPTETAWMKGRGIYYTGWMCAKIERIDP